MLGVNIDKAEQVKVKKCSLVVNADIFFDSFKTELDNA